MRTVSTPSDPPDATSGFGLVSQGKMQIKWMASLIKRRLLNSYMLSRNRALTLQKVHCTVSSDFDHVAFIPKRGSFFGRPWDISRSLLALSFQGVARKATGLSLHMGKRKGRSVKDKEGQQRTMCAQWRTVAPQAGVPRQNRPSLGRSTAISTGRWQGFLRACPDSFTLSPKIIMGRMFGALSFLQHCELIRLTLFFSSLWFQEPKGAVNQLWTAVLTNRFETIYTESISRILFWSKCSLILDKSSHFLNILLPSSARSQGEPF